MAEIEFSAASAAEPDGGARTPGGAGAEVEAEAGAGAGDSSTRSGSTQSASVPDVAVVLITADWAGPARPAATVLRELSRRWGDAVQAVMVDASQDAMIDLLRVDVVPTWLRFIRVVDHVVDVPLGPGEADPRRTTGAEPAGTDAGRPALSTPDSAEVPTEVTAEGAAGSDEHLYLRDLPVTLSTGEQTVLAGTWKLTTRRRGALPKHEVARDFGPDAAAPRV